MLGSSRRFLIVVCAGTAGLLAAGSSCARRQSSEQLTPRGSRAESFEESYAGWSHQQLNEALDQRKSAALVLKDDLLDERAAQGFVEEAAEATGQSEALKKSQVPPDTVALRVSRVQTATGWVVRRTVVPRGYDPEFDRLVDEVEWLMAKVGETRSR